MKERASMDEGYQQFGGGLYLTTYLYDTSIDLLVDTGATVTMISKVFQQIPESRKTKLESF